MDNRKMIYLDDAIDTLERKKDKNANGDIGVFYNKIIQNDIDALMQLPSAQPERQHGRIFQEIVVEYSSYNTYLEYEGKPYFSIKYTENGQEFIGYGTYNPEVLSEYLKEYFLPSAQPEIIYCKECANAPKCFGDVIMKTRSGANLYCPLTFCSEGKKNEAD